ncbi:MAG TPA: ABC transporter ATP-binding protein, partial [Candidatus Saccharimonadales bacterium]|nr:ABC transporter ATP-binding protein [Candidatus Saccharimonadales bacterium]
ASVAAAALAADPTGPGSEATPGWKSIPVWSAEAGMAPGLEPSPPARRPDAPAGAVATLSPSPSPVIEMRDLCKTYGEGEAAVQALRGITIRIDHGEFVSIMAPSGAGKSTLMHIMGCLDVPTSGAYRLDGQDVASLGDSELAHIRNRAIGFVFQQFNLLPRLTALANVELPLIYAGMGPAARRERAAQALERVGLAHRSSHRPNQLSGGQTQRVAIARALVTDPAVVLADEPTGNLDSTSTQEVLSWFKELSEGGRTIVLITHELEVARTAPRVIRLRDGLLVDDGPTEKVLGSGVVSGGTGLR